MQGFALAQTAPKSQPPNQFPLLCYLQEGLGPQSTRSLQSGGGIFHVLLQRQRIDGQKWHERLKGVHAKEKQVDKLQPTIQTVARNRIFTMIACC